MPLTPDMMKGRNDNRAIYLATYSSTAQITVWKGLGKWTCVVATFNAITRRRTLLRQLESVDVDTVQEFASYWYDRLTAKGYKVQS